MKYWGASLVIFQKYVAKIANSWQSRIEQQWISMSPQDHNKTLVILHAGMGAFFTLGLIASPWIIPKNVRNPEQVPLAIVVFAVVLLLALLFWSTAIAMQRRNPVATKLALIAAVVALPIGWPLGVYTWWFMHSEGAKQMYGIKRE
jgi:isoprenylcysteine carboxyl methyltransferase (ICMT) family protein YpbQ